MAGDFDLETLTVLIGSGDIDTVLVCFPDIEGRLVSKRIMGSYFLDHKV